MLGLAFGYGLSQHVADIYGYLMKCHQPGDRIFVFGFSRGAYTTRAVCSMLHAFGHIRRDNEVLVPYAVRLLKTWSPSTFPIAAAFKKTFSADVKPHFVGIWDTVSSVGALHNPLKLPFSATNPDIAIGRHAVAIDERRAFLPPEPLVSRCRPGHQAGLVRRRSLRRGRRLPGIRKRPLENRAGVDGFRSAFRRSSGEPGETCRHSRPGQ
jgi:hypothetical protein